MTAWWPLVLHEGGVVLARGYPYCTRPRPSWSKPTCQPVAPHPRAVREGEKNDRLTAAERTGDGPVGCQIDDGNNVAQTGGPIHGACRDGCRQGWLTGGAESPQRTQPPRRYRDPSENRMIPRAAHQPHQPWSRHVRCTDTKPLTREAEEVCPASFQAGPTS